MSPSAMYGFFPGLHDAKFRGFPSSRQRFDTADGFTSITVVAGGSTREDPPIPVTAYFPDLDPKKPGPEIRTKVNRAEFMIPGCPHVHLQYDGGTLCLRANNAFLATLKVLLHQSKSPEVTATLKEGLSVPGVISDLVFLQAYDPKQYCGAYPQGFFEVPLLGPPNSQDVLSVSKNQKPATSTRALDPKFEKMLGYRLTAMFCGEMS